MPNETEAIQRLNEHPHQWNVWAVTGFRAMISLVGDFVQFGPPPDDSVVQQLEGYRNAINDIISLARSRSNPQPEKTGDPAFR